MTRLQSYVKDYRDSFGIGYVFARVEDGYRWGWIEPGYDVEWGSTSSSLSDSLRDAADDWDENGSGSLTRRGAVLRQIATREDRK